MVTEKTRLKDIVKNSSNVLYFYGVMYPEYKTIWDRLVYMLRVGFFMGFMFAGLVVSAIANMFHSRNDVGKLMDSFFITVTNLMAIVKFITIHRNQPLLLKLIDQGDRREFQPRSDDQRNYLKSYVKFCNDITVMLCVSTLITICMWCILAFIGGNEHSLPVPAYFPFNIDTTIVFALISIYLTASSILGGTLGLSTDWLIASLVIVVKVQLHFLNDTLCNIKKLAEEDVKKGRAESVDTSYEMQLRNHMNQKLIECIVHHQYIIKFAREVNKLFSISILGQLGVSVICICATLYEIRESFENKVKAISVCIYMFCMLMQVFPICYYTNEVIAESHIIPTSAYHSSWEDCSKEYKQNVYIFMLNTRRIIRFCAGGLIDLSTDVFINIIKTSWSYFTIIGQMDS
ncbi:unnamed protein product [Phyllotreta striolata]|uniref:Odorant receptor n=1 Tax=Phyllotreta striolata TaxID=444603 RepID=A0A9N9U1H8_PHYSR|nr:unnamed protein product [Phyllotreta striolata]